jgi:hypothetical protein
MNLFDRFTRVAKSNINNILKNLEDPEKIMNQALEDMQVRYRTVTELKLLPIVSYYVVFLASDSDCTFFLLFLTYSLLPFIHVRFGVHRVTWSRCDSRTPK